MQFPAMNLYVCVCVYPIGSVALENADLTQGPILRDSFVFFLRFFFFFDVDHFLKYSICKNIAPV